MMSEEIDISLIIIESIAKLLKLDADRMDQIVFNSSYEKILGYIL